MIQRRETIDQPQIFTFGGFVKKRSSTLKTLLRLDLNTNILPKIEGKFTEKNYIYPGSKPVGILLEKDEAKDLIARYLMSQANQLHSLNSVVMLGPPRGFI